MANDHFAIEHNVVEGTITAHVRPHLAISEVTVTVPLEQFLLGVLEILQQELLGLIVLRSHAVTATGVSSVLKQAAAQSAEVHRKTMHDRTM